MKHITRGDLKLTEEYWLGIYLLMTTPSTSRNEKTWSVVSTEHFSFTPAIRRLYRSLQQDLDPEHFEVQPLGSLQFLLARWNENSSWFAETGMYKLLLEHPFPYVLKLRGLKITMSGIHLGVYFEHGSEAAKFHQLRAKTDSLFKEFGIHPHISSLLTIPIVRFRTTNSLKRVPNLDRWEECDFGDLRMNQWNVYLDSELYFSVPLRRIICHRGNFQKKIVAEENKPELIDQLNKEGFDVEIDVWWKDGELWLGHDEPQYKITLDWLCGSPLRIIHCKDGLTFEYLLKKNGALGLGLNLFYHTNEHYALTTRGQVIVLPGQDLLDGSIQMMPEMSSRVYSKEQKNKVFAVCSDAVKNLYE